MELHPTTGKPWRYKVGPGAYLSLPYQKDLYEFSDIPTNPIGDARGNLQYQDLGTILHSMLNPFQVPVFSAGLMNVNSAGYTSSVTLEVGQTISSPVLVKATVDVPGNLSSVNPYNIIAGGNFTNEGNFASLPASLALTPLTPSSIKEITIMLKGAYTGGAGGFTNTLSMLLAVYPKIIWGSSNASSLAPTDWASLTSRAVLVTKNFQQSFTYPSAGYLYIAIPSMLSPISPGFTDVTDPFGQNFITFDYQGVQTINNGVGTYGYATYRSRYVITANPTIVQVRETA